MNAISDPGGQRFGERVLPAQPIAWSDRTVAPPRTATRRLDALKWFDAGWTAVAIGAMLFAFQLGSKAVVILLAMLPIYAVVRHRTAPRLLLAITPILALPIFALTSQFWSATPGVASYYAFQYLITVAIGATIGAGTDRRQGLIGLFCAFAVFALVSLVFGQQVAWGGGGASRITSAFAGIVGSKNSAADSAAIGVLVASATLAMGLRERNIVFTLAAAAVICIDVWILRRAESTGALIACGLAGCAMIAMNVGRALTAAARTAIFAVTAFIVVVAAALQKLWLQPLIGALLSATGKDPTLTGRTYIWDRAWRLIEARPAFGLGYASFWRRDNIEALGIWQYAEVGPQGPFSFNFHNTFIEILVHLGFVGLTLYGLVAGTLFVVLLIRTVRVPTDMGILFCAYLAYFAVRLSVETQAFSPFTFSTTMIMAGLGCAVWSARQSGASRTPRRRAVPVGWRTDRLRPAR